MCPTKNLYRNLILVLFLLTCNALQAQKKEIKKGDIFQIPNPEGREEYGSVGLHYVEAPFLIGYKTQFRKKNIIFYD